MKENMKTISQIAKEIDISEQEIKKYMKQEPLSKILPPHIHKIDGVEYVDNKGQELIPLLIKDMKALENFMGSNAIEYGGAFKKITQDFKKNKK
jgi:predicted transcriptional regulator